MTVLTNSEIAEVNGGQTITALAEIIHLVSEGVSKLNEAISDASDGCYNKGWRCWGPCIYKFTAGGIMFVAAGITVFSFLNRNRHYHNK